MNEFIEIISWGILVLIIYQWISVNSVNEGYKSNFKFFIDFEKNLFWLIPIHIRDYFGMHFKFFSIFL